MDPQQQQMANTLAGMGAGVIGFFLLFGLACIVFFVWLYWRIFTKAGMPGALALLFLVPGIGWLIVPCVLAFARWNVTPTPSGYAPGTVPAYPPSYPAQAYPPAEYPPAGPPTQL